MKKLKPWDFLQAINTSKTNLMEDPEVDPNDYVPFVANRSLSYFLDALLYANEMNLYPELDKDMQFHYYLNSIRSRKRFAKWEKPQENEDVKLVQDVFGYNKRHATQALKLLSAEDIEMLRQEQEVGGVSESRVSRNVR